MARIIAYADWLARERDLDFGSCDDLWRCSISELPAFLQSLWDFFEIGSRTPHRCVLERPVMTGAAWFPGAQFNYARLALRLADSAHGAAPTDDKLHALLQEVITRFTKMLTRLGVLDEELGQTFLAELDADGDEARTLRPLQAVAVTVRIAFDPAPGESY